MAADKPGFQRWLRVLVLSCVGLAWPLDGALADSLWDHNGSVMRLIEHGGQIEIFYEVPRSGMVEQGVQRGQLFFNGRLSGNNVTGIARAFSRRCPAPMEYRIRGKMMPGVSIILEGRRPTFKDCVPQKTLKNDRLVFTFMADVTAPSVTQRDEGQKPDEVRQEAEQGSEGLDQLLRLHQPAR